MDKVYQVITIENGPTETVVSVNLATCDEGFARGYFAAYLKCGEHKEDSIIELHSYVLTPTEGSFNLPHPAPAEIMFNFRSKP